MNNVEVWTKAGIATIAVAALLQIVLALIAYMNKDKQSENSQSKMFINAITGQMEKLVAVIQVSNNNEFANMIKAIEIGSRRQEELSAAIHELSVAMVQSSTNDKHLTTETHRKVSEIHNRINEMSICITLIEERTKICTKDKKEVQ